MLGAWMAVGVLAMGAREARGQALQVGADTSLRQVLAEIALRYSEARAGEKVQLNIAPSGVVREQALKNDELDVFLGAAPGELEVLSKAGRTLDETATVFARNGIVLVAAWADKETSERAWTSLAQLDWERIAVANPDTSMSGVAARAVFEKLEILEDLTGRIIYENDSDRVLRAVQRAQANAGVIYRSDQVYLKPRETFRAWALPEADHPPIVYSGVVLKHSRRPEEARAFLAFAGSAEAGEIWERHGFELPKVAEAPAP